MPTITTSLNRRWTSRWPWRVRSCTTSASFARLEQRPEGTVYTASGALIGHFLQGRDIVREAAATCPLPPDTLLRLEHLIIAHQRLPEWGSPKPPMTPEALLVHYADDIDAKFHMMVEVLRNDTSEGPVTSKKKR